VSAEANREVIRTLNRAFEQGDNGTILACLADDIIWHVPPHFTARGKPEFRANITSPVADGPPVIDLRHLVAEDDTVTVEGYVTNKFKGGAMFRSLFHNAYRLRDGKVYKMTSYVVPLPETGWDPDSTK
jgi:ketosteroid isomerase-like protein